MAGARAMPLARWRSSSRTIGEFVGIYPTNSPIVPWRESRESGTTRSARQRTADRYPNVHRVIAASAASSQLSTVRGRSTNSGVPGSAGSTRQPYLAS